MAGITKLQKLRILHLAGSPEQMGEDHGTLLADEIAFYMEELFKKAEENYGTPYQYIAREYLKCRPFIPESYLTEMRAMAEASGLPFKDILAYNCFVDLEACYHAQGGHCHNFIAAPPLTQEGLFIHGRNLDFPCPNVMGSKPIAYLRHPSLPGASATFSLSWPGYVGTLTGYSVHQISVGMVSAVANDVSPDGMPIGFLIRSALERASSCEDFVQYLKNTPRTAAFNLAIADGKACDARAIEFTQSRFDTRGPIRDLLVVDDFCLCEGTQKGRLYYPWAVFRHARMTQLLNENRGNITLSSAFQFLRDRFDLSVAAPDGSNNNCICNRNTVQSVVFLPAERRLFAVQGKAPAPEGSYTEVRFDEALHIVSDAHAPPAIA